MKRKSEAECYRMTYSVSGRIRRNQRRRFAGIAGYQKTRAYLLTRQMNEAGLIEILGKGTDKKYKIEVNSMSSTFWTRKLELIFEIAVKRDDF